MEGDALSPENANSTELQFRRLWEHLPVGAYTCNRAGLITYFNAAAARLWGREPRLNDPSERFCGSFRLYNSAGSPLDHAECWMAQALETGEQYHQQEIIIERPDGTRVFVLAHATPLRDAAGSVIGAVNVLVDVTTQKASSIEQAHLASIVESSEDAIVSKTLDGVILSWNQGAERLFGYTAAEAVGQPITLIIPADRIHEEQTILSHLRHGEPIRHYETVRVAKSGEFIDISVTISPIRDASNQIVAASKIARNITRQKRAETALQKSERQLQIVTDTMAAAVAQCDAAGRYTWVSRRFAAWLNLSPEQIVGQSIVDIVGQEGYDAIRGYVDRALAGERVEFDMPVPFRTIGNRWVQAVYVPTYPDIPPARPDGWVAVIHDITRSKELEEALRESEARFRNLANNAPALIWVHGTHGCEFVNSAYLRYVGRSLEQVQGLNWSDFVHPDDGPRYMHGYQRALERHEPFETEFRFRRADGEYRWLRSSGVPRFAPDGKFLGLMGCSIDIDDMKRSSDAITSLKDELGVQLADLRRLHQMSLHLSKTLELDEILHETLRTAATIEGTELGQLSLCDNDGHALHTTVYIGLGDEARRLLEPLTTAEGVCQLSFREARRVVIEDTDSDPLFEPHREAARIAGFRAVHCTPLVTHSGDVLGVLSMYFREPHYPSNRELHLIDLCVRQAVDFIESARLYAQLRESDRRKDEFLAMLAHELRNPLAPISNSLHLLRLSTDLPPVVESVRDIMERQVNHMVRLVDDLLEVSRITRGKIELRKERVDLAAVISSAVETSRPAIDAAGHQLAISLPPQPMMLDADLVRLAQVIANLLNNAAKYTNHGGQIWLHVRQEGDEAVISVRDNGLGIPPSMLPRVFDMFAQADRNLSHSQGGLGIGLALAKSLVQLHGGRIEAHSAGPGTGSEFIVRLPLVEESVRPRPKAPAASAPVPQCELPVRRILVVDDTRAAAYTLGRLLEAMGQQVKVVFDGAEAVYLARSERPDIVISDVAMPGVDGYQLAQRLRREPQLADMILVALTGYGQDSDRREALEAGFDHHLIKPVDFHALRDLLASLATRSRPQAQMEPDVS
ncbi:MAG: PAS domain S-box protein [Planctomycetaceae bacterium]|nr:PAS domain S-box protein [Planctomycetaceae bacterium]